MRLRAELPAPPRVHTVDGCQAGGRKGVVAGLEMWRETRTAAGAGVFTQLRTATSIQRVVGGWTIHPHWQSIVPSSQQSPTGCPA